MTPDQIFDHHAKRHMIIYAPHGFRRRYRRLSIAIMASIKQALETPVPSEPKKEPGKTTIKSTLEEGIRKALEKELPIPLNWIHSYNIIISLKNENLPLEKQNNETKT